MPYARRKTTSRRPRRTTRKARPAYRRKRVGNNPAPRGVRRLNATVQRGQLPFGRSFFARLPYVSNYTITAPGITGLSTVPKQFLLNSAYSPDFGGGHQPLQYDQLTAAYNRIWVHACKITLEFTNPTADGMYVGYRVRNGTNSTATSGHDIEYVQEMKDVHVSALNNSGSQRKTWSFFVRNHAVMGVTKTQYQNFEYSHIPTNNPAVLSLLEPFAIYATSSGTGSAEVRLNVKMTLYCQFTDPITLGQS